MRHLFSLTFIGLYITAIPQWSFLAFSNVLDNGALTFITVALGLTTAPIVRLIQKWRHNKSANVIVEYPSDSVPFHHKILNFPMIVVSTTLFMCVFLAVTNHTFASDEVRVKVFKVIATGQKRVRYDFFEYVRISDGFNETTYSLGTKTKNQYNVGDQLEVQLRKGFWGYYIVTEISK